MVIIPHAVLLLNTSAAVITFCSKQPTMQWIHYVLCARFYYNPLIFWIFEKSGHKTRNKVCSIKAYDFQLRLKTWSMEEKALSSDLEKKVMFWLINKN